MSFAGANPEDRQEVTPDATDHPREPRSLLVLGISLYLIVLAILWLPALQRQRSEPALAGPSARLLTYQVTALHYWDLYGDGVTAQLADSAQVPRQARQAADAWETIAREAKDTAYAGMTFANAAALYGIAGNSGRARAALQRAARIDHARTAAYRGLLPLYAARPRAVTFSPAQQRLLASLSTAPIIHARNARLAGDTAAARAALQPGLRAGIRVLIAFGTLGVLLLGALLAAFILAAASWGHLRATFAQAGTETAPPVPWGIGTALILISAVYLLTMLLTGAVITLFALRDSTSAVVISTVAQMAATVVVLCLFLRLLGRPAWEWGAFGWRRARRGLLYGALALLVTFPLVMLASYLSTRLFGVEDTHPLIPLVLDTSSALVRIYFLAIAMLMAPLVEETLFRGLLFRAANARMTFWPAAMLSALVFAAGHAQVAALLPIFVLGLLFAFLTRATDSLLASATAHALFNGVSMTIVLLTAWLLQGPGG